MDSEIISSIDYNKSEDINVLGIGASCGSTILRIKNMLKIKGIPKVSIWYLSEAEKYITDLKTICDHVICAYTEDKSAESIVLIEKIKNLSTTGNRNDLNLRLCARKVILSVNGKNDFKKVLVYPGYDWIINDAFIEDDSHRSRLGIDVGKAPYAILRDELFKLGYKLCSIDTYDIKDAEFILFMDAPKSYNNKYFRHIYNSLYKGKSYFDECIRVKKVKNIKMILLMQEPVLLIKEIIVYDGELRFNASKSDGTPRKLHDVGKLRSAGWEYKIEFREGIIKSYEWYVKNIN